MSYLENRICILLGYAMLIGGCFMIAAPAQQRASDSKPQAAAALPSATGGQYAETDICKTCHQEVWDKHFANTPHSALLKGDRHG